MKTTVIYAIIIIGISALIENSVLFAIFRALSRNYSFGLGYIVFVAVYLLLFLFMMGAHHPLEDTVKHNIND